MIREMRSLERSYSMESLYQTIGKSRQHYAQRVCREQSNKQKELAVIDAVMKWREEHPRMGSRAMYYSMLDAGIELGLGVSKFEGLLSERGLTIGKIRRYGPQTSDGKGKDEYENLTNGLILDGINQLIVGDITYYWVDEKWHYIFTLKDVYSQRILGIQPSRTLQVESALKCLTELEQTRGRSSLAGCIHHTDDGSQYNAIVYVNQIKYLQMRISRSSSCQENGSAEQLNHVVKNMYMEGWSISTFKELVPACKEFKYLNNERRAIAQLGYLTPIGFEKALEHTPNEQRIKKTMYDFNK